MNCDDIEEVVPDYRIVPLLTTCKSTAIYFPLLSIIFSGILALNDEKNVIESIGWGISISLVINFLHLCIEFFSHLLFRQKNIVISFQIKDHNILLKFGKYNIVRNINTCSWKIGNSEECQNLKKSGKRFSVIVLIIPIFETKKILCFKHLTCKIGCGLSEEKFKQWKHCLETYASLVR